jgi:hypothetical protein
MSQNASPIKESFLDKLSKRGDDYHTLEAVVQFDTGSKRSESSVGPRRDKVFIDPKTLYKTNQGKFL